MPFDLTAPPSPPEISPELAMRVRAILAGWSPPRHPAAPPLGLLARLRNVLAGMGLARF